MVNENELAGEAKTLSRRVAELRDAVTNLDDRLGRNEKVLRVVALITVLVFILAAGLGWGYARINGILADNEIIRTQVNCPSLATSLGSYNPYTRHAGVDRQVYEDSIDQMRYAYTNLLHCSTPLVPPRIDLPGPQPTK